MPTDPHLLQLARERMLFTGEPERHAIADLIARPFPQLPVLAGDELAFDAEVFDQLQRAGGFYWAHPFGIRGVWRESGKTIIKLDHVTYCGDAPHLMSDFAVQQLLPYAQWGSEIGGVPGLRYRGIRGNGGRDLHLVQAGGSGHVVLRGTRGTQWARTIQRLEESTREQELQPLWSEGDSLTSVEAHFRSDFSEVCAGNSDLSWIGAGVLQRINLFFSSSTAYTTGAWITGDRWIFEMMTLRQAGHPHDVFLRRLCDARWGLPLALTEASCRCANADPERECECRFWFSRPAGGKGTLELRFRWQRPGSVGNRDASERVGAPRAWLDRVAPICPSRPFFLPRQSAKPGR